MSETRILADWVSGLRYEDIPEDVREHARRFILDNFGCQIAGATLPWSKTYYDMMKATRSGSHSTVAFYGDRMSPDDAAFLNSTFNHANETDDTHLKSPTHPGGIAVPAALALSEYANATGEQLLVAVVAAYEIQIRLSWACSPFLIYRGHHPPVGVGPFGAAAAGAVLLGFDSETTVNAFAIAGSHSAGLIEYTKTGGSVKRIHSAIPTQAGVRAALFAQSGITGPHSIIEGEKGFCKVFAGEYDLSRLTDGLGSHYHLLDNGLKPYSCCHLIHAAFDALDNARDETPLTPDNVKSITVATNSEPILSHIGSITEPTDILGAQFSLPFSMAMRLHHGGRGVKGGNGFWDYVDVDCTDPALVETARKVKVTVAQNDKWERVDEGAGLEIETTDGREDRGMRALLQGLAGESIVTDRGGREVPLSGRSGDARGCGRPRSWRRWLDWESIKDINDLVRLLVVPQTPDARAAAE